MARRAWLETAGMAVLPVGALLLALNPPALVPSRAAGRAAAVRDGRGETIRVGRPFAGAVIYAGIAMPDYLLVTEAPGTILDTFAFQGGAGKPTLLNRVFPAIGRVPVMIYGRPESLETMLLQRPGAVLTWNFVAPRLDRLGLPAIGLPIANEADLLQRTRIYAQVAEKPGRDTTVIGRYEARFASLQQELRPESITSKRRVLMLNRSGGVLSATNGHALVWHRAGLVEAQPQTFAGNLDVESLLAIDPDLLLLSGDLTLGEVRAIPGLRSLRAVREGWAYTLPPGVAAHPWNIVDLPFYARWLAELAYPERLGPTLRGELRAVYAEELGYQCSEDDLDHALGVEQNRASRGYARFSRTIAQ